MEIRDLHQETRRAWNEAAVAYERDLPEQIAYLRNGGTNFGEPERPILARLLPCHLAIHLQCAGGTDTLSLWNAGAKRVIGLDISESMLSVAQQKSEALGAPASWIHSDVLDAPHELNGTADLVYTGRGALCWILDIEAWAKVVARLLRPGGSVLVFDGHPITWLFTLDSSGLELESNLPYGDYFATDYTTDVGWPSTYVGDILTDPSTQSPKHERQWHFGHLVNALVRAGLAIEELGEHPDNYWDMYPNWSPELSSRIPQTFTLVARKPV